MLVGLLNLTLIGGCATDAAKLKDATYVKAVAQAPTILPKQPEYCREDMPTVVPVVGEKWRWTQKRWEIVREAENKSKKWCADNADKNVTYAATGQSPQSSVSVP